MNKGLSYLLPSKIFLTVSEEHIPHIGLCLFIEVQKYLHIYVNRIYLAQWYTQD